MSIIHAFFNGHRLLDEVNKVEDCSYLDIYIFPHCIYNIKISKIKLRGLFRVRYCFIRLESMISLDIQFFKKVYTLTCCSIVQTDIEIV